MPELSIQETGERFILKIKTLECENDGERLDVFLTKSLPELTRSAAQKLLDAGLVTLDGKPVRKNHRTSSGDIYIVTQDEPDVSVVSKQDIPLDIIFEDKDLIVVNKPRGMVVHPAPGHNDGTLVNALLFHCGDSLSGIGGVIRPGIVHRIDKDTSGLVIAAKNDRAHISLASQLASRSLVREYHAIVCGCFKNNSGTVDAPIGRHPVDRKKQAVYSAGESSGVRSRSTGDSGGRSAYREAVTHYEVIAGYSGYAHVLCRLETGRTHQIRVHMAYIGHPVLGDLVYGRKKPELGMSSQCLHAWKLCFVHPSTGERIELFADLPDYFTEVLEKLERRNA